mgnify:CR=1 FL=1|tara:strand:+ start:1998 stop:2159 length:162 start_codon:yes stop_codon:yes gene_type:complete
MAQKTKSPAKPDDPAEYERFLATAKEAEADETAEGFERAMSQIITAETSRPKD